MYKNIRNIKNVFLRIDGDSLFLLKENQSDNAYHIYKFSIDGCIGDEIPITHYPHSWRKFPYKGHWLVQYRPDSRMKKILNIFSLEGVPLASIHELEKYPCIFPINEEEIYLVGKRILRFKLNSSFYADLGDNYLGNALIYEGKSHDLFFITQGFRKELIALRDNHGTGLEDVYRLDFSESDRWKGFLGNKNLPGTVKLLNFYKDDVWVTTPERVHRIEVSTGRTLEIRDYTLPNFFLDGNMGDSLSVARYKVMDMERGELLYNKHINTFIINGEGCYYHFKSLLLHDGNLYVSVRLDGGVRLLAIFDTGTERFVWYDIWGSSWSIESVHIIGDRLIAYAEGEVRIYVRSNDSHVTPTDMFLSMN